MYLVSLFEKDGFVEASLGGRVTADEIRVFGEELLELVESFDARPYNLLIDYSKAKKMDAEAVGALAFVKDTLLETNVVEIVSVPTDEQDLVTHQSTRLQYVLEGRERFVADANEARFVRPMHVAIRKAA